MPQMGIMVQETRPSRVGPGPPRTFRGGGNPEGHARARNETKRGVDYPLAYTRQRSIKVVKSVGSWLSNASSLDSSEPH